MVATEARVNTVTFSPSPEAIAEFKVLSGSYSAEYGFNAGAQTIIVTKSGGNEVRGSVFEFLRSDRFDAEHYFQNYFTPAGSPPVEKDSLRQDNFGGVLSGPLMIPKLYDGHNRTFFMVNYEGRRRRQGRLAQTANSSANSTSPWMTCHGQSIAFVVGSMTGSRTMLCRQAAGTRPDHPTARYRSMQRLRLAGLMTAMAGSRDRRRAIGRSPP